MTDEIDRLSYTELRARCKEANLGPCNVAGVVLRQRLRDYYQSLLNMGEWEKRFKTNQPELYAQIRTLMMGMPDLRPLTTAKTESIRSSLQPWTNEERWQLLYRDLETLDSVKDDKEILELFNRLEDGETVHTSSEVTQLSKKYMMPSSVKEATQSDAMKCFIVSYPALFWLLVRTHPSSRLVFLVNGYNDWLKEPMIVKSMKITNRIKYAYHSEDESTLKLLLDTVSKKQLNQELSYYRALHYVNEPLVLYMLKRGVNIDHEEMQIANIGSKHVLELLYSIPSGAKVLKEHMFDFSLQHFTPEALEFFIANHSILGDLENVNTASFMNKISKERPELLRTYLISLAKKNSLEGLFGPVNSYMAQLVLKYALRYNQHAFAIELMEYGQDPRLTLRGPPVAHQWMFDDANPLWTASSSPKALEYIVQHYILNPEEIDQIVTSGDYFHLDKTLDILSSVKNLVDTLRWIIFNNHNIKQNRIIRKWIRRHGVSSSDEETDD